MIGAAFSDGHISCLLTENDETSKYLLVLNSEDLQSRSHIVKLLPATLSGPSQNQESDIEITDFSKPIPFKFQKEDTCGIVYFLLQVAYDDTYDFQEPFVPNKNLWVKDSASGKIMNTKTRDNGQTGLSRSA